MARIREIFFYKESRKMNFFDKESKSNKKNSGGWEGKGWGCGKSFFFFFFPNESKSEIKKNFF